MTTKAAPVASKSASVPAKAGEASAMPMAAFPHQPAIILRIKFLIIAEHFSIEKVSNSIFEVRRFSVSKINHPVPNRSVFDDR